jgi:hypothetical protein
MGRQLIRARNGTSAQIQENQPLSTLTYVPVGISVTERNVMTIIRPENETIVAVQEDLERLGATCRVRVKREVRGKWENVRDGVEIFETALDLVPTLLETVLEVGIFLDHERYGGILIWTSTWPSVVNQFSHLER